MKETFTITYTVDGTEFDFTAGRPIYGIEEATRIAKKVAQDRFVRNLQIKPLAPAGEAIPYAG